MVVWKHGAAPEFSQFAMTDKEQSAMGDLTTVQQAATHGLHQIEGAIIRLLSSNPQGLRNSEIADMLNLRSEFRGGQRNYLTHSVLGGLLAKGEVVQDHETKLYKLADFQKAAQGIAQQGLHLIEDAILTLLRSNPQGLRNSEIADMLNLRSEFRGGQRNYLTHSVLGGLLAKGEVVQDCESKLYTKR